MPRPPRLDLPGLRHHVMNRGARHERVFPDENAGEHFLSLVGQLPERFGLRVHAYALVGNHYHLLLECPVAGLPQAIQFLQSRYSRWLNLNHSWDGPVWRGRYRNQVVDDPAYWRHLLAYLHLNPVRAGLAPDVDRAAWTSHRAYWGLDEAPSWLSVAELRDAYGTEEAYRAYLAEQLLKEEDEPDQLTGSHLFGTPSRLKGTAAMAPRQDLSVAQAWARLEEVSGLDRAALAAAPRGRKGNPGRWVAMWWLQAATALSQAEAAAEVGAAPSLASRAVARVRQRPRGDGPEWARWADQLEAELLERDGEPVVLAPGER